MSGIVMLFPDTVEEFMEQYKMVDREHVYSNGIEYVPIFRMKQWFDHQSYNDAVEVVRCRDCRWYEREQPGMVYCPLIVGGWVEEGWFCAAGERREG